MIDRPDFDERLLGEDVEFLPIGLDGRAWAYRVGREFVKLRLGEFAPAAYRLPMFLRDHGLEEVVAPLGEPRPVGDGFWLLRYPFHEGGSLWSRGLTDDQWVHYGRFLGRLHAVRPDGLALSEEPYTTTAPARVRALHSELPQRFRGRVGALCDAVEAVRPEPRPHVICHADIHPGNLLALDEGRLHVVDWDAPILAPRERDLMFVFSGDFGEDPINPHREALFRKGYGPLEIDGALLSYYVRERQLDDIAGFLRGMLDPAASPESRANDLRLLTAVAESISV